MSSIRDTLFLASIVGTFAVLYLLYALSSNFKTFISTHNNSIYYNFSLNHSLSISEMYVSCRNVGAIVSKVIYNVTIMLHTQVSRRCELSLN